MKEEKKLHSISCYTQMVGVNFSKVIKKKKKKKKEKAIPFLFFQYQPWSWTR